MRKQTHTLFSITIALALAGMLGFPTPASAVPANGHGPHAMTSQQATSHSSEGAKINLGERVLIKVRSKDNAEFMNIIQTMKDHGAVITIAVPPSTLIGYLPHGLNPTMAQLPFIEDFYYSDVPKSEFPKDETTQATVRVFNDIFSRVMANPLDHGSERLLYPLTGDVLQPPQKDTRIVREMLTKMGLALTDTATTDTMCGTVAVGIFFLESDGAGSENTYDWTTTDYNHAYAQVLSAFDFWASLTPNGYSVTFVPVPYDPTTEPCGVPYEPVLHNAWPIPPQDGDNLWINHVMDYFCIVPGFYRDRVTVYNTMIKGMKGANWAFSIFVAYNPSPAP